MHRKAIKEDSFNRARYKTLPGFSLVPCALVLIISSPHMIGYLELFKFVVPNTRWNTVLLLWVVDAAFRRKVGPKPATDRNNEFPPTINIVTQYVELDSFILYIDIQLFVSIMSFVMNSNRYQAYRPWWWCFDDEWWGDMKVSRTRANEHIEFHRIQWKKLNKSWVRRARNN